MRKVKMTFESLYALSGAMNELSNDLHMRYLEIDSLLESIETSHAWIGSDESSYYQLLKEKYMTALNQVNRTLDDYSTYLEKSCQAKECLENDMASKDISVY